MKNKNFLYILWSFLEQLFFQSTPGDCFYMTICGLFLMVYECSISNSMVYEYSTFLKKVIFSSLCTKATVKNMSCVEHEL